MNTFEVDGGQATPVPTPGRIVHYRLSAEDIRRLNDAATAPGRAPLMNPHATGDLLPAIVVRAFNGHRANLQVFVDGELGSLWVTSRRPGTEPGQWTWPTR